MENSLEKYVKLSDEEKAIIDAIEKYEGRKLSEQEINLSLKQARAVGEL